MILHALASCVVFPVISLLSQARQLQGAAQMAPFPFLSLRAWLVYLVARDWKDKYGQLVRPESDEESVTCQEGRACGKGLRADA